MLQVVKGLQVALGLVHHMNAVAIAGASVTEVANVIESGGTFLNCVIRLQLNILF